ncbi:hypothetical protein BGZ57DRAFT_266332 [Hyaloscypha finlandica]|nr:hypothetical protein BGZ57DRAFT_266332 [Hyaloscypha finlandica]
MFEVSWTDPERETVGERKSRKQQRSACASRNGPTVPPSRGSTSGGTRPPVMNVFGPSWKEPSLAKRRKTNSSSSTLRIDGPKALRKQPSFTSSSASSFHETPRTSTTTTRTPDTEFFSDSYHSDYNPCRLSSQSEVSDSGTNSTWSLNAESICSSGKIVQQLSPTSFVTQSTEITVSPRESIRDEEQVAIMVHISASGIVHTHDSAGRRPSQAAVLDFLNDNGDKIEAEEESSSMTEKAVESQAMMSPVWRPIPWEPPEVWECSTENKEASTSSKPKGLGLPFRPAGPRRRSERGTPIEKSFDE